MIFTETRARRRLHHRPRAARGRPRLLRAHVLPERVRRARAEADDRAGERRLQPRQGHAARDALPVSAGGRDEARALHARRDPRHHRRPAAREPDVPASTSRSSSTPTTAARSTCRSGSRTATRRSATTRRRATRSASSTRPAPRAALAATTRGSGSAGRCPVAAISEKDAALGAAARSTRSSPDGCAGRMEVAHDHRRHRTARPREAEGRPIRVGIVGAGFMGQGLTNQIVNSVPGMRVAAIYEPASPSGRVEVFRLRRARATRRGRLAGGARGRDRAPGGAVVTDDPFLLCRSEHDRRDRRGDRLGRVRRAGRRSRRSRTARTSC